VPLHFVEQLACGADVPGLEARRDEGVVGDGALVLLRHIVEQGAGVRQRVGLKEGEGDGVVREEAEAEEERVQRGEERQGGGATEEGQEG